LLVLNYFAVFHQAHAQHQECQKGTRHYQMELFQQ
jgi:hypothetical protein